MLDDGTHAAVAALIPVIVIITAVAPALATSLLPLILLLILLHILISWRPACACKGPQPFDAGRDAPPLLQQPVNVGQKHPEVPRLKQPAGLLLHGGFPVDQYPQVLCDGTQGQRCRSSTVAEADACGFKAADQEWLPPLCSQLLCQVQPRGVRLPLLLLLAAATHA
jgi:hypothetical protein